MKAAGTSVYPTFNSLLDLAELCARPFFSTFFNADFSAFDCFKFLSNICNIDLMPLDFKADSFELSGCVFKPNYTVNTS